MIGATLTRGFPGTGVLIRDSLLNTTRTLYNGATKVTYVLKAKSGSYFCSKGGVATGVSPLKCVLKSRNDKTMLKGHLMNSLLGRRLPSSLYRSFLGRCSLAPTLVLSGMCQRPLTGHFLTNLAPFLFTRGREPRVQGLLVSYFASFFAHGIVRCRCRSVLMRFANSVTFFFRRRMGRTTLELGISVKGILGDPLRKLGSCRFRM